MTKQHINTNKFQLQLIPHRLPLLRRVPIIIGSGEDNPILSFRRNLAASFILFTSINANVNAEIPAGMTKQHINTNKFQMQLIPHRLPLLRRVPIVIGSGETFFSLTKSYINIPNKHLWSIN